MKEEFDTVIVGAGASGLVAAIEASKNGAKVLVIERMDAPGKKILATGNGKCNMTNLNMDGDCYRGSGQDLARYGISNMTPEKLRRYFYDLGLYTIERDGYVYPATEQSKTVVRVLKDAFLKQGGAIHTGETVTRVFPLKDNPVGGKENKKYEIATDKNCYRASYVVLSTGGKAAKNLGSDGSGYVLAKELGLKMKKPLPALTALTSPKGIFKALSGVRMKGALSLFVDGKLTSIEKGEIQLTAYGISGIPAFQISRYAVEALDHGKKTEVSIDFYPFLSFQQLRGMVRDFRKKNEGLPSTVVGGLVHEKWVSLLLKEANIPDRAGKVPEKNWNQLIHLLKEYPIPIDGFRSFDFAQACQGGIMGSELTKVMESRKYKGLYLTGELVDVDGSCGGYNLHWAFTSGYLAGKSIAANFKHIPSGVHNQKAKGGGVHS